MKISLNIEMPTSENRPATLEDKVNACLDRMEYDQDHNAYKYLRKVYMALHKAHNSGCNTSRVRKLLGLITPIMHMYGLSDSSGVPILEEFLTGTDCAHNKDKEA